MITLILVVVAFAAGVGAGILVGRKNKTGVEKVVGLGKDKLNIN